MGRSLSPILRQEFENLDKDADSRKSAMKALKSYVKELDSKAIPLFLAQVSETKDTSTGEFTISLYEVLARVHGPKIVPQIDNIMTTIIKILTSSGGSFALHQACSKVVPAISRYGIDPTTPEEKKRYIIHSLCKPLSDSLLGSQESLSSGSALCLKALVDSDNWRFASNDMVNEVCQRAAAALDKPTQSNSHLGLIMSLAKHNSFIVEAYARLLVQSGLQILHNGVVEGNSQKRLSAIQMINFLMKSLDPKSLFSELGVIVEEMERCQSDQMAYVRGAAFEALQTARRIITEKGSKLDGDIGSASGSNFSKRDVSRRRNFKDSGDQSPLSGSPESQTLDSFAGYDSLIGSSISTSPIYGEFSSDRRSVNRKLWRRSENGGVDVSLKDGLYSEVSRESNFRNFEQDDLTNGEGADYSDEFAGFLQRTPRGRVSRNTTPSPQRTRSPMDSIRIFTTPRKLIRSLQNPDDKNSNLPERRGRRSRSPCSCRCQWSTPTSKYDQNGLAPNGNYEIKKHENHSSGSKEFGSPESVSSTDDVPAEDDSEQVSEEIVVPGTKVESKSSGNQKRKSKFAVVVCAIFFMLIAFLVSLISGDGYGEGASFVPT